MAARTNIAPRNAQRKRIFPHREVIFRMLDDGCTSNDIREALKLDDIPLSTFEKNIRVLKRKRDEERRVVILQSDGARDPQTPLRAVKPDSHDHAPLPGKSVIPKFVLDQLAQEEQEEQRQAQQETQKRQAGPRIHPDANVGRAPPKRKSAFSIHDHEADEERRRRLFGPSKEEDQ